MGDVLTIHHGFAFKGEYFDSGGSQVLLTPKNFRPNGGLELAAHRCKRYEGPVKTDFVLKPGNIVLAMTDLKQDAPILGSAGVIDEGGPYLHNQRIGKVVVDREDRLDAGFTPWLLNSPLVRDAIRASATGATVRHTAPVRIEAIEVELPSIAEQRRIAAVLSAFDELIEVDRRRIQVIELGASALYNEWFVRMRTPSSAVHQRVDSPMGRIPRTWRVLPLSKVSHITMGQSPKSEFIKTDAVGLPFHQGVSNFGTLIPTATRYCGSPTRQAEPLDVLCSVRAPVGRLNVTDQRIGIGRGLSAVHRLDGAQAFLSLQLRQALGAEDSIGGGTIYKAIGKDQLYGLLVLEPDRQAVEEFERAARPMLDLGIDLTLRIRMLEKLRDFLLSRLVTGQLDISEVDLGILTPAEPE